MADREYLGTALYAAWIYSGGTVMLSGKQRSFVWTPNIEYIDAQAGSDATRYRLPTLKDWAMQMDWVAQTDGTAIISALAEGTSGTLVFGDAGTAQGRPRVIAAGMSQGVTRNVPYGDIVTYSASIIGDGTALDAIYDYYVDSVNGSDDNDGKYPTTAFATIAKLLTVMEAGDSVGLVKGSTWNEVLELPGDNCTVAAYGTGNRPHFECRDTISAGSWSKTVGQTNVYEASIAFTAALAAAEMHVWEDGTILARVADLATCDATAGSFVAVDISTSPQTLYVHASDASNPGTSGKVYRHRSRAYGVGPNTVNGTKVTGIKATGPLQGSGGIIGLENCVFTDCEVVWGASHNMYVGQGSTITNCLFTDAAHSTSASMLVLNQDTPTGGALTVSGCTFSLTSQTSWGYAAVFPFYGHNNVSGDFGTITFSSCTFTNLYSANVLVATGATSITLDGCTFTNCLLGQTGTGSIPVSITNSTWTSNRASQRVYTNTYAGTVSYEDCTFTITGKSPATDGYFYANADGTTLSLTDCTIDTTGVENIATNNRWIFYIDHAGVELNLLRVTFLNTVPVNVWEVYQILLNTTPTSWSSDYNSFNTYFRCYYNSTAYETLGAWQTATSQDANSTYTA